MVSSGEIDAALADLGRQLAARRDAAGLAQWQLAKRIGCARSTVGMAEAGNRRSPDFWRRADDALEANGAFTAALGKITASAEVRRLPPLRPAEEAGALQTVKAPARCPHCRRVIGLIFQGTLFAAKPDVTGDVTGSGHGPDT